MAEKKIPILHDPEQKERWIRGLYILLFLVVGYFACVLIFIVTIFQFVATLIWHKPNENILTFSKNIGTYLIDIIQYVTYNSEKKPYPFSRWQSPS